MSGFAADWLSPGENDRGGKRKQPPSNQDTDFSKLSPYRDRWVWRYLAGNACSGNDLAALTVSHASSPLHSRNQLLHDEQLVKGPTLGPMTVVHLTYRLHRGEEAHYVTHSTAIEHLQCGIAWKASIALGKTQCNHPNLVHRSGDAMQINLLACRTCCYYGPLCTSTPGIRVNGYSTHLSPDMNALAARHSAGSSVAEEGHGDCRVSVLRHIWSGSNLWDPCMETERTEKN